MSLERLEAELARIRAGRDPDRWALAAYRVAVARSEAASGDLDSALDLLERAGRILTEARAPVEHARICTAAGNCHRRLGRPEKAAPLFKRAADLVRDRAPTGERAAALVNLGLALTETGRPDAALEPLSQAVGILAGAADPEARRVRAAALINRAQALQAQGGAAELESAVADYRSAAACADEDTPQRGMALHGLGSAILEQIRSDQAGSGGGDHADGGRGRPGNSAQSSVKEDGGSVREDGGAASGPPDRRIGEAIDAFEQDELQDSASTEDRRIDEAIDAFEQALGVLTEAAFPFQHAIARHSLAVAFERRGGPSDAARALVEVEVAISIFDPRLHRPQWRAAADTLAWLRLKLEAAGPPGTESDHFARLLAAVTADERAKRLRDRLQRLASVPEIRCRRDLDELASALTRLGSGEHEAVEHKAVGSEGEYEARRHEAVEKGREHEAREHEAVGEHETVDYETVMRSMIPVLMELPDSVLDSACASLAAAHRASGQAEIFDETLDRVIHDLLHGPQRVRVRDLLTAAGWVRP